jgi:hypothetical protein
MSIIQPGNSRKYICDACGKSEIINLNDNLCTEWTMCDGANNRLILLCSDCWKIKDIIE